MWELVFFKKPSAMNAAAPGGRPGAGSADYTEITLKKNHPAAQVYPY
jgi:hypothetical protein